MEIQRYIVFKDDQKPLTVSVDYEVGEVIKVNSIYNATCLEIDEYDNKRYFIFEKLKRK